MKNRIYIKDLKDHLGKEITIAGWVDVRRDQGKMVFFDLRDMSGKVQCVTLTDHEEALVQAKEIRPEWVLEVRGLVKERNDKNAKQGGGVEIEVLSIKFVSKAEELPFDLNSELNLDTYLNNLPLMLHSERTRDIFTIQASVLESFRASLSEQGFTEFMSPAIVGGDAEGGSAAFKLDYFKEKSVFLATSPQLYKQIMVAGFEKVFTVAKVFRAERSATTRHISESTQMDFEMGFIETEREPMKVLEQVVRDITLRAGEQHLDIFKRFNISVPEIPKEIPIFTLNEAHVLIEKEFSRKIEDVSDMSPEDERKLCEYVKKNMQSDFVFITRFPTAHRAFYTFEDPSEAPFSRGFDLLFRGLEITSGAQRIHNYENLVQKIKDTGLNPEKFAYYLQAFKYGMPPHGGCSTGLERFTARMLELPNIKEATAFPRDMTRIDGRLSE